jgi:phospholipid transport system substrate-binding protein
MQRRTLLALSASAAVLSAVPRLAFAQEVKGDPAQVVSQFAQIGIVQVLAANIPKQQKSDRFRVLFKQFFDIPSIARFTLGRFWKAAQPDEQTKFLAAFEDVIVYTWTRRFSEYNGQTLKIQSTAPDGDDGALITSTVIGKDVQPIAVAWRLRKRDDGWRVVDVIVEGISMAGTYRQEYASIINEQGGVAGLVTKIQNQAADLAKQASAN